MEYFTFKDLIVDGSEPVHHYLIEHSGIDYLVSYDFENDEYEIACYDENIEVAVMGYIKKSLIQFVENMSKSTTVRSLLLESLITENTGGQL